jgi:hypothetical protein
LIIVAGEHESRIRIFGPNHARANDMASAVHGALEPRSARADPQEECVDHSTVSEYVVCASDGGSVFQIGNNQTVCRQPVLFFCVINQGVFGALTVINSFPGEGKLLSIVAKLALKGEITQNHKYKQHRLWNESFYTQK